MRLEEYRAIIARSPWFEGLPEAAIDKMAAVASIKHYAANDYIYAQGKHTTEVYCLIEGRMRISISSPDGQEFAVVDMDAEAWLGEPGLANDLPRVLDGRLVTKAIVLEIPRKVVLAIGDEYPIMYRNLFCT